MFTISSNDLPSIITDYNLPFFTVNQSSNTVFTFPFNFTATNDLIETEITDNFTIVDNTLTIVSPVDNPTLVIINGVSYDVTQFTFDGTNIIILNYTGSNPISIIVYGLMNSYPLTYKAIPTDFIPKPYSYLFYNYNYNGSLTYNRSFKGHPTLSLTFVIPTVNELSILSQFRNGKQFTFENIGYFVDKVSLTREGTIKRKGNWSVITIDMTGKWSTRGNTDRNPLDEPIFVEDLLDNKNYYELTQLCRSQNVYYTGKSIIINVPKNSKGLTTTIRDEIEKRAITIHGFPYYSNPNRIEIRTWAKTTVHYLSNADIIEPEYTIEFNGHGAIVDGFQLSNELRNAEIIIDNQTEDENKERTVLWEFENCQSFFDARNWFGERGVPKLPNGDVLKTPSGNFNNGGINCVVRKKTMLNGTEIMVEEWKYGLQYKMNEIYNIYGKITFLFPDNYWGLRESSKKYTVFDENGYITAEIKEGWTTAQFKKETAFETQELSKLIAVETDPAEVTRLNKELATYDFFRLPIDERTTYTLDDFRNYYADVQTENQIPPLFVRNTVIIDGSFQSIPDPSSTEEDPKPPLVTGRDFKEERNLILATPTTIENRKKTPEKYVEVVTTYNREGEFFQDVAIYNTITEMSGRPPVATKVDISESELIPIQPINDLTKYKYLLNTEGSERLDSRIITGSVSYPDIMDIDEIVEIAKTDYSMQNTQNAVTTKLKVRFSREYQEGDRLYWNNQMWVIFSISNTQLIERNIKTGVTLHSEGLELTLGKYLKPDIEITRLERENND